MSRTIDERVVEMRFDNKQFEANIDTSISSINKLNKSLDLKGASRGLENVNAASKGVGVGIADLGTVVEGVKTKFSALQVIATTALVNITNSAVNTGKRLVSSLSIDQLTAGWSKYEQKTANVQTLMNSTGKSIDEINGYLDKLMWFSDETSYGFTDMTAALAQMTSSGGNIEKLIPMITGVANATAYAGKGASEFSRVIYNLNQSYGAGYLQLMDWKSLELAGVGSLQLKETLIQTAEALGKVKKGQVTVANFSETLKDKWADTEVMEAAFGKFGEFSDAVQKMVASGEVDTAAEAIEKLSGKYGALGEKAFRSAQEAKSFSEAIDATKDAVSSGWLRTYEIIFGNYEEAKVLWTDLANTLWDIFASGADARNEMLKEWVDLGGRADVLEGIVNIFHAIQAIIEPVSEAFSEMFPAITAKRLFEITEKFKILTNNFKLFFTESETGKKVLNDIKRVFKGVFSVLDIGVQLVSAVAKSFGGLLKAVAPIGAAILNFAGNVGDAVVELKDFVKANKVFEKVANKISSVLAGIVNGIVAFVKNVSDGFGKFNKVDTSGVDSFTDKMKQRFKPLIKVGEWVKKAFDVICNIVNGVGPILLAAASKIGEGIGKIFNSIGEAIRNSNFNLVLDLINGGLLATLILGVKKFIDGLSDFLDSAKDAINSFTASIKVDILVKIATAIAILTASLLVLSLINSDKLAVALGAMTAAFVELFGAFKIFTTSLSKDGVKNMRSIGGALIGLATSVLILSIAMNILSKLSWEGLAKGIAGLAGAFTTLVISAGYLANNTKGLKKGTKGIISLSLAILILSVAVRSFAKLNLEEICLGTLALAAALGVIVGFVRLMPDKKISSLSSSLLLISVALTILGGAFAIFAHMSMEQIGAGILAMAGALTVITVAMHALPKSIAGKAVAMTLMASALLILAPALAIMGSMPVEKIGAALLAIAGALTILTVAMHALPKDIAVKAVALMMLASALMVLAPALAILGNMSLSSIGSSLLMLAGALVVLGVAAYALRGFELTLIAIGAALVLVGAGCVAISAAVVALSAAFIALVGAGASAITMITSLVASIIGMIPVLFKNIGLGIVELLGIIAGAGEAIIGAITTILSSLLEAVKTCLPQILDIIRLALEGLLSILIDLTPQIFTWLGVLLKGLIELIKDAIPQLMDVLSILLDEVLLFLVESTPKLVAAGTRMILDLLAGIRDAIPKILRAASEIIVAFANGISAETLYLINAGFKMIIDFVNGLAEAIRGNTDPLIDAFGNLADAMIDGLVKGLGNGISRVVKKAKELANAAWNKIKDVLGIHSPSRKFMELGEYSGEGFALGLQDMESDAEKAAVGIGKGAVKTLSDAVSGIADIVSSGMDTTPTIRPVIDLSDVESGAKEMSGMFGQTQTISVNSSTSRASSAARAMSSNGVSNSANQNGGTVFTFTQNNYSPKALSKVEIYRQTKNQISAAKEAIKAY